MPLDNSAELISALYVDTRNDEIKWHNANYEATRLYPTLDIIRAFKTNVGDSLSGDYFLAVEYLVFRYNPDFDFRSKESGYLVAFVSGDIVGKEYCEAGYPSPIDIKELIDEIAFHVSNADIKINNFLHKRKSSRG